VKVREPIDVLEWAGNASGVLVEEFAESLGEGQDQRAERIADALFRLRDHVYSWYLADCEGRQGSEV
jgi:hypothetical protein